MYIPNVVSLLAPNFPASGTAVAASAASYTIKVYVSVSKGAVPVSSGAVSQTTVAELSKLALLDSVYVALFALHDTITSILDGSISSEV